MISFPMTSSNQEQVSSPEVSLNSVKRRCVNVVLKSTPVYKDSVEEECNNTKLVSCMQLGDNLVKPSSLPNSFLAEASTQRNTLSGAGSSQFLSVQDSDEDTESFLSAGDNDENDLANEINSRNEAEDELAELLGGGNMSSSPARAPVAPSFVRPANPIVHDRHFAMARSSAPSLEAQAIRAPMSRPLYYPINPRFA
jgi:hypothetical protein